MRCERGTRLARGKGYTLVIETIPVQGTRLAVAEAILYNRAIRESKASKPEDEEPEEEESEE